MSRSIVTRLAVVVALCMIVLAVSLTFLARRGVDELARSMESTTDRILNEDIRNKSESDRRAADEFGQAMAGYLASIARPPLWDYDYRTLEDYAQAMLEVPNVIGAVIYREDGSVAAGKPLSSAESRETAVFSTAIMRNGERIGSVELFFGTAHLETLQKKSEETREELLASFKTSSVAAETSVLRKMSILFIFIFLGTLVLSTFVVMRMISPLRDMTRAIRRFGGIAASGERAASDANSPGHLSQSLLRLKEEIEEAAPPHGKDEPGILSSALASMAALLQSRLRVQRGVTDIMNVAAVSGTKEDFAWNLLRLAMEETPSCMAAFYIRNEAEPENMDRIASVGLPPDSPRSIGIRTLDGQFGAAVLKNGVSVHEIPPAASFSFNTVAGALFPAQFLTLPIHVRGEPTALFTMASLAPYPEEFEQIFSLVREGLNAAVSNLIAGERERELVQDLQAANQELAAQSEELEYQARELEEQNAELNIQRRKSEEASRLKTEFLSNMSHELRTPLNSILALSRVLRSEGSERLSEEELEYLHIIERNGKNLLGLINGILDLSRIEAGREELRLKELSPEHLITELTESLRPLAQEKGVTVECVYPNALPCVITDEEKLRRILTNIAGNAVKFTDEGSVEIRATAGDAFLSISVSDSGIGIHPSELPFIFDEFRQSDGSMARKFEGTGLGLAIAKKYAEVLGITLSVESTPGKGSTFTLDIPLHPGIPRPQESGSPAVPKSAPPRFGTRDAHLHVVEDNPVSAMQVRRILEADGFRVSVFASARESLDAMDERIPDGVILDLMMPEMDGFAFLKELRARKRTIPVLVLTAKVLTREDAKLLNEYSIRHLALKGDVDPGDLLAKIRTMTSQGGET